MTEGASTFSYLLSWLTLVGNIFAVIIIFSLFAKSKNFSIKLLSFLKKYSYELSLLFSVSGVIGSLVYSEFIGFEPCFLCWWQRIFLYPMAIILFVALFKRERNVTDYLLSLSIPGTLIALYHSYIQWFGSPAISFCSDANCFIVYFTQLGYVTLPFMAFSAFLLVVLLMFVEKYFKS